MKKFLTILLAMAMALSLASCGSQSGNASDTGSGASGGTENGEASDPVRVACILSGPISDMSWNYTAHQGLLKIESMGAEIAYQENVENSALPDCINTYAADGYDIIILSTNSYEEAAMSIVSDYPDTQFIIINGGTTQDNVTSYAIADEDQGFMQGAICTILSANQKVGFVGAMEITPILNGRAGFEQGAKYINPDVEINAVMTGSFTDVAAAKETSKAMIDAGVDAIAPMCDNAALGVDEAAEEGGIIAVASGEGQESVAPNAVVCAVVKDTSLVYERAFQDYLDGKLTGDTGVVKLGAKDGVVYLSDWYDAAANISDEAKAQITAAYEALASGEVSITLG
ncbi:basic membrane protein A [Oscillibacter sp. PC13]|uniref:BMP family protein n=1 Tax=Oscillibacter sp. PC13 TaxID=1855299 RepID=UPI0008F36834|nr:BMP family protein [Oscillibacter sp. PC13]SFQ03301.1 basic membrane protein A [Oscillibacter sp. PC13]